MPNPSLNKKRKREDECTDAVKVSALSTAAENPVGAQASQQVCGVLQHANRKQLAVISVINKLRHIVDQARWNEATFLRNDNSYECVIWTVGKTDRDQQQQQK